MLFSGLTPNGKTRIMLTLLSQILVSYGIYLTLNVICLHYLVRNKKRNFAVIAYTVLSLLASTVFMTSNVIDVGTSLLHIENTMALQKSLIVTEFASYQLKLCLADSLLIYRLWVIYEGMWLYILLPFVLLAGTFGTIIAEMINISNNSFNDTAITLGVAVHGCSVGFNLLATSMIVVKLWKKRKWAKNLSLDHAKVYLSISAIFAESGALYAVVGIVYIALIVVNSPVTYIYSTWMDTAAGIAPLLILLRLAFSVAISRETMTNLSNDINNGQQRTKASEIGFSPASNDVDTDIESFASPESAEICKSGMDERVKQEV